MSLFFAVALLATGCGVEGGDDIDRVCGERTKTASTVVKLSTAQCARVPSACRGTDLSACETAIEDLETRNSGTFTELCNDFGLSGDACKTGIKSCNHLAESLHGNAWTTNPQAMAELLTTALADVEDSDYLMTQLADLAAVEVARELVHCALTPEQSVAFSRHATGEPEWRGESGLCPEWRDNPIANSTECQELVSACLLAKNNPAGQPIPIGLRGQVASQELEHERLWMTSQPLSVASFSGCTSADGNPASAAEDCGWSPQPTGRCAPGETVEITLGSGLCESPATLMVRVCDDLDGCDNSDAPLVSAEVVCGGDESISFMCGASGHYSLMSASAPVALAGPEVSVSRSRYPLRESDVLSVREGAFFGNLFRPGDINGDLRVHVEDRRVIYEYLDQERATWQGCAQGDLESRRATHRDFMMSAEVPAMLRVHPNAYACSDWRFGAELSELEHRTCARTGSKSNCIAQHLGECTEQAGTDVCLGEHGGDRDYHGCEDGNGQAYDHPLTVFVAGPCEIMPGLCDGSGEYHRAEVLALADDHGCVPLAGRNSQGGATTRVRCWGGQEHGETGHSEHAGDDELPSAPVSVRAFARQLRDLASAANHTCALDVNGVIECWGESGETTIAAGATAERLALTSGLVYVLNTDQTVSGYTYAGQPCDPLTCIAVLTDVEQLVAGGNAVCARLSDGSLPCWPDASNPGDIVDVGIAGATDIAVSGPSSCALHLGGTRITCMDFLAGTPNVIDLPPAELAGEIAMGDGHVCALLSTGRVRCYGDHSLGQLGHGGAGREGDAVLLDREAVHIASGAGHVCAVLGDEQGTIQCWGDNSAGQLGCGHVETIGDDEHPIEGCTVAH